VKLITPESSPIRIWLILFLAVFLALAGCLSAAWTVICLLKGAPLNGFIWILAGSAILAVFSATSATGVELRVRRERRERMVRIPGCHPTLGKYIHWPSTSSWSCNVQVTAERSILLTASGSSPADEQAAQWTRISGEWITLMERASKALPPPPKASVPAMSIELVPTKVEILADGGFEISFTSDPICEEIDLWPTAYFSPSLALRSVEWLP
jgi:hypothetical protein